MIYFLFLNHPKGEELYKVAVEKEKRARKYFESIDTIQSQVEIRGKDYKAVIDYGVFSTLSNFDCFNCQDPCCADNPAIYEDLTRKLILDNIEEYNSLTRNVDILEELGYTYEDIEESIAADDLMVPEEHVEEEISLCTCSYKPTNASTLCAIHSICLGNGMGAKEVVDHKPIICSLWPIEILAEDDLSKLYITLPDDFTNGFTIEDFYSKACINMDFGMSAAFRRTNPEGFDKAEYKPLVVSYGDTIMHSLGEQCYFDIRNKLISEGLVSEEEFKLNLQQIEKGF